MALPFDSRVVLITGASSGIGRAAARAFSSQGATVVLAARRADRLEALAAELSSGGRKALAVPCDVTSEEEVARLMDQVRERLGAVHVLVNNAGVGLYGPLEKIAEAQLRQVFEVNVFGLWRTTRLAMPLLRAAGPGAAVVNVSSVLGHRGLPLLGGYCASKGAVNVMTESMRSELQPEGISVHLVSPGLTESEFRDQRLHAEGFAQEKIPLKEMSAEDVAEAIVAAVRGRKRETVLTFPGKVMVAANRLVPRLMDLAAKKMVGPPVGSDGAK